MSELSFFVPGQPAPKGSMKPVNVPNVRHTILVPDNEKIYKPWVRAVVDVATLALAVSDWPRKYAGPVLMTCRFLLPMPLSRPAYIRRQAIAPCTVTPDLDKLTRAIGDACKKAEIYRDDSVIVKDAHEKFEVAEHQLCGVEVMVRTLDDELDQTMAELLARRRAAPRPPISMLGRR